MVMFKTNKLIRGFTLIELLIVVAIIGILAALLTNNFVAIRERARDAQRKSDLRQLQSSLELYRSDNGGYPVTSAGVYQLPAGVISGSGNCPNPGSFTYSSVTYMKKIPCDPIGVSYYNTGDYYYSSDGTNYTLAACVENVNDKDQNVYISTSPSLPAGVNGVTGCTSGYYFVLQNP